MRTELDHDTRYNKWAGKQRNVQFRASEGNEADEGVAMT